MTPEDRTRLRGWVLDGNRLGFQGWLRNRVGELLDALAAAEADRDELKVKLQAVIDQWHDTDQRIMAERDEWKALAGELAEALREIADYGHEMDGYALPPKQARKIARKALARYDSARHPPHEENRDEEEHERDSEPERFGG